MLSFHQENSAIAEGLVPLSGSDLESSELGVLCCCSRLDSSLSVRSNIKGAL